MGNDAVKNIILMMVLIVLSMLVGAQISDGVTQSIGAFAVIAVVGLGFVMLFFGKRCWQLLYLLPAFLYNAPLGDNGNAGLYSVPLAFISAACILAYGLMLWGLRSIRFRWRTQILLDLCVLIIVALFVLSYIKYPVSIKYFDPDAEYVGGKEYFWVVFATLYYIALSIMSGSSRDIIEFVKKGFYAYMLGQSIYVLMCLQQVGFSSSRYTVLSLVSSAATYFVFSSAPFVILLHSPKKILSGCLAMAGVLMCGGREIFISTCMALCFAAVLKREIVVVALFGMFIYAGLFALSQADMLAHAAYAVQRPLTVIPGLSVSKEVEYQTSGSSKTRKMAWQYAFDTRTGMIKDYVWGDGFQTSMAKLNRGETAFRRGEWHPDDQAFAESLAASGSWHNGYLSTVHRLGFVGLAIVNFYFICGLIVMAKVSNAFRNRQEYPYMMALMLPVAQIAFSYPWGTLNLCHVFASFFAFTHIKMLYCAARDEGLLRPLFQRGNYVPLMIQSVEKRRKMPNAVV